MGPSTATPASFVLTLFCAAVGISIYVVGDHKTGLTIVVAGVVLFALHRFCVRIERNGRK